MVEAGPSACVLIIGNEILSGRTQDVNLNFLATRLGEIGVRLAEARVISDVEDDIVVGQERIAVREVLGGYAP